MKTRKMNFTVPEDVAAELNARVASRKRSAFVAFAVREQLRKLEGEELRKSLIEGYQSRRQDDAETEGEWQPATVEGWQ